MQPFDQVPEQENEEYQHLLIHQSNCIENEKYKTPEHWNLWNQGRFEYPNQRRFQDKWWNNGRAEISTVVICS